MKNGIVEARVQQPRASTAVLSAEATQQQQGKFITSKGEEKAVCR